MKSRENSCVIQTHNRAPGQSRQSVFLLALSALIISFVLLPMDVRAEGDRTKLEPQSRQVAGWPVIAKSNLDALTTVHILSGHSADVISLAISPDSTRIATGSSDGELRIWDASSGDLLLTLQAHRSSTASISWSPDGRTLASSSYDRFVKLWDVESGELLRTIEARLQDYVLEVQFTPDGKQLAIAGPECLVVLRDVDSGILFKTYHQRNCLPRSGGPVYSWGIDFDESRGEIILGFSQPSCNCGSIQRWELDVIASNELIYGFHLPVKDLDLSPDRETIAIAMVGTSFIRVINADSIYPMLDLQGHMFRVNSLDYSPDGELLVSASNDRRIGLWDADSSSALRLIPGHRDAVTQVEFSPDGSYLVSTSKDDLAIVWAIDPGE